MEKLKAGVGVRKGVWTKEEDILLTKCVHKFGEGRWHLVPLRAGLNRCRKSCRLRWLNYLNPNVKRGLFTKDEVDLIVRMHKLLGNRWSLIAGRIPGRTANDIKNFWNTHIHKRSTSPLVTQQCNDNNINVIIRPQPQKVSRSSNLTKTELPTNKPLDDDPLPLVSDDEVVGECMSWWGKLINTCSVNDNGTTSSVAPFSINEEKAQQPMILFGDQAANLNHHSTDDHDGGYYDLDVDAMWEIVNMDI